METTPPPPPDPWHTPGPAKAISTSSFIDDAEGATQSADPSGPPRRRPVRTAIAWNVILFCTIGIVALQLWAASLPAPPPSNTNPRSEMTLTARMSVGFELVGPDGAFEGGGEQLMATIDQQAALSPFSATDQLRAAIIASEHFGRDELLTRLEQLQVWHLDGDIESPNAVMADRDLLMRIYENQTYQPSAAERQQLIDRHGWFGEMAASHNLPASDPLHQAPRQDAKRVIWFLMGFVILLVLAGLAGIGLFMTAVLLAAMGKIRPRYKATALPHNSAYLELVALFLLSFIVLQLIGLGVALMTGLDITPLILCLMVLPVLWPLLCGVSLKQYRMDMGLTAPHGTFREIALGVLGYLAGLPVIFVGMIVTIVLAAITGIEAQHPASEEITKGDTYMLITLVFAAVIWAPIVEELVFRAAFYRHLRRLPGWASWLGATVLTSFVFAVIHPQGIIAVPILMSIAFVLAGLRQWRGSLIAPMTAHALHNGAIITLALTVLYL